MLPPLGPRDDQAAGSMASALQYEITPLVLYSGVMAAWGQGMASSMEPALWGTVVPVSLFSGKKAWSCGVSSAAQHPPPVSPFTTLGSLGPVLAPSMRPTAGTASRGQCRAHSGTRGSLGGYLLPSSCPPNLRISLET